MKKQFLHRHLIQVPGHRLTKSIKMLIACMMLVFASSFSFAQIQLSNWLINGQQINFLTPTPTVSSVPNGSPAVTKNNCMYDNTGNLVFYVQTGSTAVQIFNKYHALIQTIGTVATASDIGIIPSPDNLLDPCNQKYFIISNIIGSGAGPLTYGLYDANGNAGNGQYISLGLPGVITYTGILDLSMAISRVRPSGFRYLYFGNSGSLDIHQVSASGISFVNTYSTYNVNPFAKEMEVSNNGDKLAVVTNAGTISVIDLTTAGVPAGPVYTFTPAGGGTIGGLEFDNSGRYLFYSRGGGNSGVYVKDLFQPVGSASTFITGTSSFTGMLEKSYYGSQIICGSPTQIRGINPNSQTLNAWSIACNGMYMPDQIDGENYTPPAFVFPSVPFFICSGGNANITVNIPASLINPAAVLEVKNMTNNNVPPQIVIPQLSQTFTFPVTTTTQFRIRYYHPSSPLCNVTRYVTVLVRVCTRVKIDTHTDPSWTGRFFITGESEEPALEEAEGVQTSWMIQEMHPETNEPVVTVDNPECWRLPVTEPLTFKGYDASLSDPSMFTCDPGSPDGSFDVNKNYLVTRTSWTTDPHDAIVSGAFITGGTVYEPPFAKKATGVAEVSSDAFAVYPNPSKGQISIKTNVQQAESIRVYNAIGMLVTDLSAKNSDLSTIDLSHLPNGIYTVKVQGAGKLHVQKVLLQK